MTGDLGTGSVEPCRRRWPRRLWCTLRGGHRWRQVAPLVVACRRCLVVVLLPNPRPTGAPLRTSGLGDIDMLVFDLVASALLPDRPDHARCLEQLSRFPVASLAQLSQLTAGCTDLEHVRALSALYALRQAVTA